MAESSEERGDGGGVDEAGESAGFGHEGSEGEVGTGDRFEIHRDSSEVFI